MLLLCFFRRLAPLFALLCLLMLVPASYAQNALKPPSPVEKLAVQAQTAYRVGRREEALRLYKEALTQARQNKEAIGEGWILDIGNIYADMNQMQKALEAYNQALALAHVAGNKRTEADAITHIGDVYLYNGQLRKALEFYQQALPLHVRTDNKLFDVNALIGLGIVYRHAGQYPKATEILEQTLLLCRQIGDMNGEARTLNNIGITYDNAGQWQKALEFYEQTLPLYRQTGDKNGEAAALTRSGTICLQHTSQPQKAAKFYEQVLSLYQQASDRIKQVETLRHLSVAYRYIDVYRNTDSSSKSLDFQVWAQEVELGMIGNAIYSFPRSWYSELSGQQLPSHRQTSNKQFEINALTGIGIVYLYTGEYPKATEILEQTLLLCRQIGDKDGEADVLTNIGTSYLHQSGYWLIALKFYEQALPLYRQLGNKDGEAAALTNMGDVHRLTGQPQKALDFYEQALPLYRQLGNKDGEAAAFYRVARSEQLLSRSQQALIHVQHAVDLLEQLRNNVGSQGEARSAFLTSRLGVYYYCLNLLHQQGQIAEVFALTQKIKARSLLDLLTSSQIDLLAALTSEERQQLQQLRGQAQSLNRHLIKEGVENEVGAKQRFAALQEQLKLTESQLQTLTDRLYALHPGLADQQQARTATIADMATLLPSDTALLEYVQTSDSELLLFVITMQAEKPQVHLYPIAVNSEQFPQQCSAFHDKCADPRQNPSELAASLSQLLLSRAQSELQDKKRLIICPDGPLWDVAFAALSAPTNSEADSKTDTRENRTLWQQYEISYAYSATGMQAATYAHIPHKPTELSSVLVLANPFFGNSSRFGDLDDVPGQRPYELPSRPFELPSRPFELPSRPFELPSRPFELPSRPLELPSRQLTAALQTERGKGIKALPGAQQEAEAIHRLFPDAAIYTGKAAQEHIVTQEAGKYKYLHFATHGFFNDAAPLLSCIVLAQPEPTKQAANNKAQQAEENKAVIVASVSVPNADVTAEANGEDGLLTARKVFGLHLNADLVTLSACNSGRGQVRTGEGIVGLTWAFFAAGCPSQVVSQWSVDDAATGQLMADFYANLKAGKSKSAALRAAALKLSKDGKHSHPYYWTPFFLMGDWK